MHTGLVVYSRKNTNIYWYFYWMSIETEKGGMGASLLKHLRELRIIQPCRGQIQSNPHVGHTYRWIRAYIYILHQILYLCCVVWSYFLFLCWLFLSPFPAGDVFFFLSPLNVILWSYVSASWSINGNNFIKNHKWFFISFNCCWWQIFFWI